MPLLRSFGLLWFRELQRFRAYGAELLSCILSFNFPLPPRNIGARLGHADQPQRVASTRRVEWFHIHRPAPWLRLIPPGAGHRRSPPDFARACLGLRREARHHAAFARTTRMENSTRPVRPKAVSPLPLCNRTPRRCMTSHAPSVAAGILPAVEPWLPAWRKKPHAWPGRWKFSRATRTSSPSSGRQDA